MGSLVCSCFYLLWAASCLESGLANERGHYGVILHDPSDLLGQSLFSDDRDEIVELLVDFQRKMSGPHLLQWAVHGGLAVLDAARYTSDSLGQQIDQLAQDLGFNDTEKSSVLVVLSELGVEVTGSLFSRHGEAHVLLESAEWVSAEELCREKLSAGKMGQAAQAAFDGLLKVLTGSTELVIPHTSFKQKQLWNFTSPYQVGEVWQNICGDRVCRELVLGDVRQLSDVFERYYHEAMTFPALNLLGVAQMRRVLVLGGGDGGIATCALQFASVEKVVNVDIDARVSEEAGRWFPKVSSGFKDPRCEVVHSDAFAWVQASRAIFDLVIIDFTDEPIEGAWSEQFFTQVRGLMSEDGIVVQNVGTMATPEDLQKLFRQHQRVFGAAFPIHALVPDYLGPYILVLSSMDATLQPLNVNWESWTRQKIPVQYYDGPEQHMALFTAIPADVMELLGLPLEGMPCKIPPLSPLRHTKAVREKVVFKEKSKEGNRVKVTLDTSYSLHQDWDTILSTYSWQRDECLMLPALSILGDVRSVLVLGGGTGALASLALQWKGLERLVVLEVDESVVRALRKYFPTEAKVLSDPRTELIMDDAFSWISTTHEQFDLVILSMFDQPWLPARRTTRVPAVRGFYRQLRALMKPGGLLAQEAGSVGMPQSFGALLELHRQTFAQTWPLAMSSATVAPTDPDDDFDGLYFRVPRLLLLSARDVNVDPTTVHWQQWQGFVEKRVAKMMYYHPAMHRALFVLPAELQRRFHAPPPWLQEAAEEFIIQSFMTQAHGCSGSLLNDVQVVGALLKKMAALADLTSLGSLEHTFEPQGVTALLLVSESHLSIHTWPEMHYAALDVVSCKAITLRVRKAIEAEVANSLGCDSLVSHFSRRGRGFSQVAASAAGHDAGHDADVKQPATHMEL